MTDPVSLVDDRDHNDLVPKKDKRTWDARVVSAMRAMVSCTEVCGYVFQDKVEEDKEAIWREERWSGRVDGGESKLSGRSGEAVRRLKGLMELYRKRQELVYAQP